MQPSQFDGPPSRSPRRGCSGLAYSVDYVTEEQPFDEKIETAGGIFYVDGASVLYLVGSVMDWREDDFAAGFRKYEESEDKLIDTQEEQKHE